MILLMAFMMIVPVFVLGVAFVSGMFKSETPEYIAWEKKIEYRRNELEKSSYTNSGSFYRDSQYSNLLKNRPAKYQNTPLIAQIIGGILAVPLGFVFILFLRGLRLFFLWAVGRLKTAWK
jgi:hypothetical protein